MNDSFVILNEKTKRLQASLAEALRELEEIHEMALWRSDPLCMSWKQYCRSMPLPKKLRKALKKL